MTAFSDIVRDILAPPMERKPRNDGKHRMDVDCKGVTVCVGYDTDRDGNMTVCAAWVGDADITAWADALDLQCLLDDIHDDAVRSERLDSLHHGKRGAW